jgi:membrane protein YdbS with pleckstrin-like domain
MSIHLVMAASREQTRTTRPSASYRDRVMTRVRITITMFIAILLTVVSLGWVWTNSHQPPPLRTASHIVLAIAAAAGVFALTRIWRRDPS